MNCDFGTGRRRCPGQLVSIGLHATRPVRLRVVYHPLLRRKLIRCVFSYDNTVACLPLGNGLEMRKKNRFDYNEKSSQPPRAFILAAHNNRYRCSRSSTTPSEMSVDLGRKNAFLSNILRVFDWCRYHRLRSKSIVKVINKKKKITSQLVRYLKSQDYAAPISVKNMPCPRYVRA